MNDLGGKAFYCCQASFSVGRYLGLKLEATDHKVILDELYYLCLIALACWIIW